MRLRGHGAGGAPVVSYIGSPDGGIVGTIPPNGGVTVSRPRESAVRVGVGGAVSHIRVGL